jgi:hypothetical protein
MREVQNAGSSGSPRSRSEPPRTALNGGRNPKTPVRIDFERGELLFPFSMCILSRGLFLYKKRKYIQKGLDNPFTPFKLFTAPPIGGPHA